MDRTPKPDGFLAPAESGRARGAVRSDGAPAVGVAFFRSCSVVSPPQGRAEARPSPEHAMGRDALLRVRACFACQPRRGNHTIPQSAPSKGDARQRTCGFVRAKPCWQGGESPRRRKPGHASECHGRCGCKSARICGKMRPHISGPSLWHDGLRRAGTARPTAPGKPQGFRLTTPRLQPSLSRFPVRAGKRGGKVFQPLETFFPIIGKTMKIFFQSLENGRNFFPIIGKNGTFFPTIGKKFSNGWKIRGGGGGRLRSRSSGWWRSGAGV